MNNKTLSEFDYKSARVQEKGWLYIDQQLWPRLKGLPTQALMPVSRGKSMLENGSTRPGEPNGTRCFVILLASPETETLVCRTTGLVVGSLLLDVHCIVVF